MVRCTIAAQSATTGVVRSTLPIPVGACPSTVAAASRAVTSRRTASPCAALETIECCAGFLTIVFLNYCIVLRLTGLPIKVRELSRNQTSFKRTLQKQTDSEN